MRLAEARTGGDIGDYWSGGQGMNQLVAYAFAQEELWPMRPGTSMTWGENYLRAWRRAHIERMEVARQSPALPSGDDVVRRRNPST
jgi:hypothetical protein